MLFDDDFLLESDVARDLYQRYAAGQPIIDTTATCRPSTSPTTTVFAR